MRADVRFRAMGTDIHLIAVAGSARAASAAVDRGRERIEQLEALWSRFRPASEVSVMNALAGMPVRVSPETIALVQRALDGVRLTGGRFDPTVLGAVDPAPATTARTRRSSPVAAPEDDRGLGAPRIEVDPVARLVRLPAGVGFDPGGIGKGLAADIVARELADHVAGICVNVGGDLRVHGDAPDGPAWGIEVEDPFGGAARAVLSLADGAVATSSRTQRVLRDGGHHLIDPATGLPAASGVASATAIAGQGWIAEVLAKASFLAGAEQGCHAAGGRRRRRLLVLDDGSGATDPWLPPVPRRGGGRVNMTWEVARAGGIVAWGLATASVVWGLALSTRLAKRRPWPAWLLDMHRFLGALAVVFTVVHVGAVLLDSYTHFSLAAVLVPFVGDLASHRRGVGDRRVLRAARRRGDVAAQAADRPHLVAPHALPVVRVVRLLDGARGDGWDRHPLGPRPDGARGRLAPGVRARGHPARRPAAACSRVAERVRRPRGGTPPRAGASTGPATERSPDRAHPCAVITPPVTFPSTLCGQWASTNRALPSGR